LWLEAGTKTVRALRLLGTKKVKSMSSTTQKGAQREKGEPRAASLRGKERRSTDEQKRGERQGRDHRKGEREKTQKRDTRTSKKSRSTRRGATKHVTRRAHDGEKRQGQQKKLKLKRIKMLGCLRKWGVQTKRTLTRDGGRRGGHRARREKNQKRARISDGGMGASARQDPGPEHSGWMRGSGGVKPCEGESQQKQKMRRAKGQFGTPGMQRGG